MINPAVRWRNPKLELPPNDSLVFIMLAPHKWRGSLAESVTSIEIVAGEAFYYSEYCRIDTNDEYGTGSTSWYLGKLPEDFRYDESVGIAWIPAEEMPLPDWYKNGDIP